MTRSFERLSALLDKPLDYHNPAYMTQQLAEAEAWQNWLIIQSFEADRDVKSKCSKYLRAIEKRLSLGQTFLRRVDEELKRGL